MKKMAWRMLVVGVCLVIDSGVGCSGAPSTTRHTLSSGRTIKIVSVGPMYAKFGQALALSYQTDLKVNDVDSLRKEVTDIWADFRKDVDNAKVDTAVIIANEVPTGAIITSHESRNFVFERKLDIGWAEVGSKVERAAIARYGQYDMNTPSVQVAPDTAAGRIHAASQVPKWIAAPDKIARTKGTAFGYEFVVEGQPTGSPVDVKVVVEHPPFRRPGSADMSAQESWTQTVVLGIPSFAGYAFDEDWEMLAGKWTVRVYCGQSLLAERDFAIE